ncbi:MAG: ribosome silencing factor [Elusimicrobiota bacterium]|jgi:ribosome-associated protein
MVSRRGRRLACLAAQAASDKKAVDIKVLDLRSESDVTDYVMLAGAESTPQLRAISNHVKEVLGDKGVQPLHQDGRDAQRWVALDYGDLLVHILMPEARALYRLEQMWEKPKSVAWQDTVPGKRRKQK